MNAYPNMDEFDIPDESLATRLKQKLSTLNWPALSAAVVLEVGFVAALVMMGVIPISKPAPEPIMVRMISQEKKSDAPPAPETKQEVPEKPVVQVKPEVVVPPPVIEVQPTAPTITARVAAPAPVVTASASTSAPSAAASAGSGLVEISDLSTSLMSGTPPRYPVGSRRKREQGVVVLRVVIAESGRVEDVSVATSSGFPDLDQAALQAIKLWRWAPTIRNGAPVRVAGSVVIPFKLKTS